MFESVKSKSQHFALNLFGFLSKKILGKELTVYTFENSKPLKNTFDQDITEKVEINSNWTKIPLHPPIERKYDSYFVQIFIANHNKHFENYMINREKYPNTDFFTQMILPDKTKADLQVQLKDEKDKIYKLNYHFFPYCAGFTRILPKYKKFTQLEIRCDVAFEAYKISWLDFDSTEEKQRQNQQN